MMQRCLCHEGFHGHASTVLLLRRVSYSQPSKMVSIRVHLCPSFHLYILSSYLISKAFNIESNN